MEKTRKHNECTEPRSTGRRVEITNIVDGSPDPISFTLPRLDLLVGGREAKTEGYGKQLSIGLGLRSGGIVTRRGRKHSLHMKLTAKNRNRCRRSVQAVSLL
ncbi:unnamed protein product [Linum trigynum]|uniref:Uncharacterized protein n=1 Tax=Linum trigynum TaxID=586398 RepID=A0AAV2CJR2_9ROSI